MKTEDLKIDREDLKFKIEDFESGKSNVLLITGFSGSGKTTLASELAEKYDALHFQLDWFTDFMFGETTMEELEEQDEIGLIEYIKTNNIEGGQDYDSFEEQEIVTMIRDYIKFLIDWCKKQDDKFIIEGLSLYDIFQKGDDFITKCPTIILGASAETAIKRAAKRNAELDPETEEDDWYQELIKFAEADDKKLQALEQELSMAEDFKAYDEMWDGRASKRLLRESCTFNFTKEDLDSALDNLTDADDQGLELGDNFEDSDVLSVAGEPYGGTKWFVDKWADNLYIITSELWGQDGGGPEEGVYEEFDSIDEVWDYISQLEQLINLPNLKNLLAEWLDQQGKKVTTANGATLYTMSDESCDGCGCVVDGVYSDFYEPYKLINGHKLCETCLEGWIKLPKGFVDKFLLISNYNAIDGQVDEFIENLKLEQQDIDNMINEWNKRKTAGTLGLNNRSISTAESDFCNSATLLHLTANTSDFL